MPTPASLSRAKSLSRSVLRIALDVEATVAANREQAAQLAKQERERLAATAQARIHEHLRAIKVDEDRIVGSDDATKQAQSCLRAVQHARYAFFASKQVCERRLELRADRPPKAHGRSLAPDDTPQDALRAQHQALCAARQALLVFEEQAKGLLRDLEGVREHLARDAALRRLAAETDRAWIISLNSIPLASTSHAPPPAPPSPPPDLDPVAAEAHCRRVSELEAWVTSLKAEALAEVHCLKERAAKATARVEDALMHSVYEKDDVGKRLKAEAKEVDSTITHAERSMYATRKNLQRGDAVGQSKVAALEALIGDLRQTRQDLQEDINTKAALLGIDERCRKVTAAMAAEKRPGARVATPVAAMTAATMAAPAASPANVFGAAARFQFGPPGQAFSPAAGRPRAGGQDAVLAKTATAWLKPMGVGKAASF